MKLLNGDCLELMLNIPNKSVDMILCDLPYGVTDCKWDNVIPFDKLWERYYNVIKDNGAIVLFSAQPFTTKLIHSNLKHFRYCWYWKKNNKTGGQFAKYQPLRCIEDVCVFYKRAPRYKPQGLIKLDKPKIHNIRKNGILEFRGKNPSIQQFTNYPDHVLEFINDSLNANRLHPTQKPVKLLEYLIKTYTDEGDTVLDNCMGSGSTGVACLNTNRDFIGIELDVNYFEIAKNRILNGERTI